MRNRHGARTALLTGLACYLALQAVLDGVLDGMWRPDYSHKLSGLRQALRLADQPKTVVMLGSSRTAHGFKPSAMQPLLARELGRPVIVYNTGLPGDGPVCNLLTLRRFLADGIHPDLLLIEVLPAMLSGGEGIPGDLGQVHLPTASLRREELSFVRRYAKPKRPIRFLEWGLSRIAPSYYLRPRILTASLPMLLPQTDRFENLPDDSLGWIPIISPLNTPAKRPLALEHARKDYVPRLERFVLSGGSIEALEEMLELCQREQIRAALVLLPEGPAFRSWYPPGVMDPVHHFLADLSRRHGTPIIDAQCWMNDEADFLDSHHLLPAAAEAFSRRLGEEALLPLLR